MQIFRYAIKLISAALLAVVIAANAGAQQVDRALYEAALNMAEPELRAGALEYLLDIYPDSRLAPRARQELEALRDPNRPAGAVDAESLEDLVGAMPLIAAPVAAATGDDIASDPVAIWQAMIGDQEVVAIIPYVFDGETALELPIPIARGDLEAALHTRRAVLGLIGSREGLAVSADLRRLLATSDEIKDELRDLLTGLPAAHR